MRQDLTDAFLRGLRNPGANRLEVWDARVPGLVLRMTPAGAASWSVRARTTDGKRTRPTLGTWPVIGIAEARKRARAVLADVQRGADPVSEKRAARARVERPTVAARLEEWHAARVPDWSARHAGEVRRIVDREIVPAIGTKPLAETTRADWAGLAAKKRATAPAMASLVYRVCASFLGHAEAHGWIPASLLPRKGLATIAPPVASRARVLTDDELSAVWRATDRLNAKPRMFVRLLVLTGCRVLEAADVSASEIDREAGTWTIPAARAKNKRAVTLPLPADMLEGHSSGLRGFSKLKAKIDELSGVTDWRWHDLRRTARTGMTRLGVAPAHAEAALNHISGRSALERTYDRHDFAAEVIAALRTWQAHVQNLTSSGR
jgi:integrase